MAYTGSCYRGELSTIANPRSGFPGLGWTTVATTDHNERFTPHHVRHQLDRWKIDDLDRGGQFFRSGIAQLGLVTLVISLYLFLAPDRMINLWPWTLTPLCSRVVGAMFALPGGFVGLGIAFDARFSAARIILESQTISITLILIAAIYSWSDFDQAKPGTWLFVAGLATMLIGILITYGIANKNKRTTLQ